MWFAAQILALMVQGAPDLPELTIGRDGEGYTVAAATFDKRIYWDVDQAAMARAAATCGDKRLVWGDVDYSVALSPDRKHTLVRDYRHEFKCVTLDAARHPPAPANWKASATDIADARRTALTFIQRRDSGDMDGAYSMFEPLALGDRHATIAQARATLSETGPGKIEVREVTWLLDPPRAPYPGIFVLVFVTGDYHKLHFYCGHIGLYRRGPGDYQVINDHRSYFTKGGGNDIPGRAERMKGELCPGS